MTNPDLLVILQSHNILDSQKVHKIVGEDMKRYVGEPKSVVSRVCTRSLAHSMIELRNKYPQAAIRFHAIDDHSTKDFTDHLTQLIALLKQHGIASTWETLAGTGIHASCLAQYKYGKQHGRDLVYFVQDDYLYYPNALIKMVETYTGFQCISDKPLCIFPYNDPFRYWPDNTVIKVHMFQGDDRYWKTHIHTACCFMTHVSVLHKEWDLFEAFCAHPVDHDMEKDSLNKLFYERQYILLIPIPSLALHIQYEQQKDPFLDWQALWKHFADDAPLKETSFWSRYNPRHC